MSNILNLPKKLLDPIKTFLERELVKMKRTEKKLRGDNFDVEVKAKFMKKQIVQLRKALTMIKMGKYGICESCGKMIDTDRLAVKPDATICIKCERERE